MIDFLPCKFDETADSISQIYNTTIAEKCLYILIPEYRPAQSEVYRNRPLYVYVYCHVFTSEISTICNLMHFV